MLRNKKKFAANMNSIALEILESQKFDFLVDIGFYFNVFHSKRSLISFCILNQPCLLRYKISQYRMSTVTVNQQSNNCLILCITPISNSSSHFTCHLILQQSRSLAHVLLTCWHGGVCLIFELPKTITCFIKNTCWLLCIPKKIFPYETITNN